MWLLPGFHNENPKSKIRSAERQSPITFSSSTGSDPIFLCNSSRMRLLLFFSAVTLCLFEAPLAVHAWTVPKIQRAKQLPSLAAGILVGLFAILEPSLALGNVGKGQELFELNCASCHANGQNFVRESKTLKEDALIKYLGATDQSTIQQFVINSNQHKNLVFFKMPNGKLSDENYEDVTAFVSDQATNGKW